MQVKVLSQDFWIAMFNVEFHIKRYQHFVLALHLDATQFDVHHGYLYTNYQTNSFVWRGMAFSHSLVIKCWAVSVVEGFTDPLGGVTEPFAGHVLGSVVF